MRKEPVEKGYIFAGQYPKIFPVQFKLSLYRQLFQVLEKLELMLSSPLVPDSNATLAKCVQCEFKNFCSDREAFIRLL